MVPVKPLVLASALLALASPARAQVGDAGIDRLALRIVDAPPGPARNAVFARVGLLLRGERV